MSNSALCPCFSPSANLRPLHEIHPHGPGPFASAPQPLPVIVSSMPSDIVQFHHAPQLEINVSHQGGWISPVRSFYPDEVRIGNVGELLIGGFVGNKHGDAFSDVISKFKTDGLKWGNIKALGSASLKAGGLAAGLSGAASAWQNIGAVSKGLITTRDAIGNVAADSVGGLMSGTSAGLGAGAASLALRSFGVAGLPLTIGAAAAGALGGLGGSKLFEVTGLRSRVFDAVRTLIS